MPNTKISASLPFITAALIAVWIAVLAAFHVHHPPVGTYIGVLAFVAGIMTIWPPLEKARWATAFWVFSFGALLVLEINTLYSQHGEDEVTAKENRIQEDDRFASLLKSQQDSFAQVLRQNQDTFDQTRKRMEGIVRLSKEGISQVTGGDSFPEALVILAPQNGMLPVVMNNHGNYPL